MKNAQAALDATSRVPTSRVRVLKSGPINGAGDWILYWMIANRRPTWNFSLQRAVDWAEQLGRPLIVLEALRCDYRWANDRIHAFVVQGMESNRSAWAQSPVTYYPFVERDRGDGKGLLAALAAQAAIVVSDDFPCFFLPQMVQAAARQVTVRFELVDSNGLYPMRATSRVFTRAVDFRRHLQKELSGHLQVMPLADPLAGRRLPRLQALPEDIVRQWPPAALESLLQSGDRWAAFPIDHAVRPAATLGGWKSAARQLRRFIDERLSQYGDARNQPEQSVASELSPYLHFGHIAAHQVFSEVVNAAGWKAPTAMPRATASARGWWGLSAAVESFLDELITWRELGYNFCSQRTDYDRYESLPEWARATLDAHASDRRPWVYDLGQLERAETHDPLWNAAQWQLVTEGRIHNYLRMLWGKKILEWSPTPRVALEVMIELNNKYALDGRNPNSYSGICWVLGRYDRPWGPERPIFGTVRYMSSENTARKVSVKQYIRQYAPPAAEPRRLFAEH